MKVGFIGLGVMGRPMCKNLLKAGYQVTVYNRSEGAIDDVVACGAVRGTSNADVASKSDVVILMVPNSPQVREVVLGPAGVVEGAHPGLDIIDMSSIAPIESKAIAEACSKYGVNMMDAPVSGGEPKAIDGSLSIMCGGPKALFDKYYDLLMVMGNSAVHCGEINGSGNTVKLCNQIVVAVNIAAVSEAFMLGQKAGVAPEVIYKAIRGGLAGSTVMDAKGSMMLAHNYKPGFRIDLHIKDLNNALDTAKMLDAPTPLSAQIMEMFKLLHNNGAGSCDHSAIMKYYEALAGETLQ